MSSNFKLGSVENLRINLNKCKEAREARTQQPKVSFRSPTVSGFECPVIIRVLR
jgi:hypothetical protein